MVSHPRRDGGFTLVELMVVVLIIGILVTIAVPVFVQARYTAAVSACLTNQRTIVGSMELYRSLDNPVPPGASGLLAIGGSGWAAALIPAWIKEPPSCPTSREWYLLDASGDLIGDRGLTSGFTQGHLAP